MTDIIKVLKQDHLKMSKTLDILDRHIARADRGQRPDFDLLESIMEYNLNFREMLHHMREIRLAEQLGRRCPQAAKMLAHLDNEHEALSDMARRFAAAVVNARQEPNLPVSWFVQAGRTYSEAFSDHMEYEEIHFYPLCERHLTLNDWAELEELGGDCLDPLDAPRVPEEFRLLNDVIRTSSHAL